MDIRALSPTFAVSPQIDVADVPAIAQAGYRHVICNRPDAEVPPSHSAAAVETAVKDAGMTFTYLPVSHMSLTQDMVDQQSKIVAEIDGPVFAYCASGTRSSIVWSYSQAGKVPTDQIIEATTRAGYDLGGMRAALDTLAQRS